jgi:hypothetical protein
MPAACEAVEYKQIGGYKRKRTSEPKANREAAQGGSFQFTMPLAFIASQKEGASVIDKAGAVLRCPFRRATRKARRGTSDPVPTATS